MTSSSVPSSTAERDALALHDDGHSIQPGEIAIGVIIGRTSEFFDFFVYAIASVLVFPKLIFPWVDPLTGTIYSFAVFALAFMARPVGTVVFSMIDQRWGRGAKLTIALFLLGGSTAAIAFLPGYETIGISAALLLILFRMGQGFALGGSWDGLSSLLAMNAPEHKRGWYAMLPQLGAPLGLIVASLLFTFLIAVLPAQDFLDWGWRYPFFVAFAINVVALFARLRIVASSEFGAAMDARELQARPVFEMLSKHAIDVVLGAFVPLATFAMFHLVTIFPLCWVTLRGGQSASQFLWVQVAGAAVGLIGIILSGVFADKIGRRSQLMVGAFLIAVFSFTAPFLLDAGDKGQDAYILIGFFILGLSFGQSSGSVSARFGKYYRYTGSALTSDLAWLVGAAFAPLVALGLATTFGIIFIGGYLISGALITLAAISLSRVLDHN